MKPYYIYIGITVILIGITLVNYFQTTNNSKPNQFDVLNRYNSLALSQNIQGRYFRDLNCKSTINNRQNLFSFSDETIIVLFSKFGCSVCQNREIKFIKELERALPDPKRRILYLCGKSELGEVQRLDRLFNLRPNLFIIDDQVMKVISSSNIYPQIYFIKNNHILFSLFPIPGDDNFSRKFYKSISSFLDLK